MALLTKSVSWDTFDRATRTYEQPADWLIRQALRKQFKAVQVHLDQSATLDQALNLPDGIIDEQPMFNAYEKLYTLVGPPFAKMTIEAIQGSQQKQFDHLTEYFRIFSQTIAGDKIKNIALNTLDAIRTMLTTMPNEIIEKGIPAVGRELRSQYEVFTRWKSEQIARTELITAANSGSLKGARSLGFDMEKEWIAGGGNVRPSHAEAHGQRVPMAKMFRVGAERADFPGDPRLSAAERINCKCTSGFIVL